MKAIQENERNAIEWSDEKFSEESERTQPVDVVDTFPSSLSFTFVDIIILIISIVSYLFDIGSDIAVAKSLYDTGYMVYFALTAAFIILPAIVITGFSLKWYISDKKEDESQGVQKSVTPLWVLSLVGVCFNLGPVIRYIHSLYYGWKFRQNKSTISYYRLMINEDADAALLRLFECFMESGPQLILQIYILAVETSFQDGHWLIVSVQVFSILSSLFSMAWSLVSYHRTLRISLENKANISGLGSFIQLLWHLFTISSRVIALAVFASLYPIWFIVFCVSHWGIMTLWIISMKTEFCENKCGEIVYNAVLGVIYLFCYFNAVDTPTKFRYTAYYTLVFIENTIFILVWYFLCNPSLWYRHAALATQLCSYFIGITFMILYYLLLHPIANVTVKICSNQDHCRSGHDAEDNHLDHNKRVGRLDIVTAIDTPDKLQCDALNNSLRISDENISVAVKENSTPEEPNGVMKTTAIETEV